MLPKDVLFFYVLPTVAVVLCIFQRPHVYASVLSTVHQSSLSENCEQDSDILYDTFGCELNDLKLFSKIKATNSCRTVKFTAMHNV